MIEVKIRQMPAICIKTILWHPLIITGILWPYPVASQVIPDQTLGINQSTVTSTNVNGISIDRVDGGVSIGRNKLHSFQELSVPSGKAVYFSNPNGISRILARITGQNISNINGRLGVLGNSDLLLLNPNGFIFGVNARLDVDGSFLATTAQNIIFSNGSKFGVNDFQDLQNPDIEISGLELSQASGKIEVQGNGHSLIPTSTNIFRPLNRDNNPIGLRTKQAKTLGLFANRIEFDGGIISANSGNIDIGSVNQGIINLSESQGRWSSSYKGIKSFSDIKLLNSSLIENLGNGNQSISLIGENIDFRNGSLALIETDNIIPSQSIENKIQIIAQELLSIDEVSKNSNLIPSGIRTDTLGLNRGSDIYISAKNLEVSNGGRISTFTYGNENGGNIFINISEDINLTSLSKNPLAVNLNSVIGTSTTLIGNGGDLNIEANNLEISDAATLALSSFNFARSGDIKLNIKNKIDLIGTLKLILQAVPIQGVNSAIANINFGSKQGGDISIRTNSLRIEGGSVLSALSLGSGDSGNIDISATEIVEIIRFQPFSKLSSFISSSSLGSGNAGTIRLKTKVLSLLDGGVISVSSFGSGRVGFVDLNVKDSITVSGGILPTTLSSIRASSTVLNPTIGNIFNITSSNPSGESFGININTGTLIIQNGGNISVQNDGRNDAGNLTIQANNIRINDAAIIGNSALGSGGNIFLKSKLLSLNNGSISSSSMGQGVGGNVQINSNIVVTFGQSLISANAENARGGNIFFNTQGFFPSPNTIITATSALGPQFSGSVTFSNPDTDLDLATTSVETEVSKPEVSSICRPTSNSVSEFIVSGEGGLPTGPNDSLSENSGWHDAVGGSEQANTNNAQVPELVDAQGWVKNSDGTFSLVASTSLPITTAETSTPCNAQVQNTDSTLSDPSASLRTNALSTRSHSTPANPSPALASR